MDPGVLGVHLVDNLVPLSLQIPDNKATELFIHLLSFSNRETLLDLEELFVFGKHLLLNFLPSFGLDFRELKIGLLFLLTSTIAPQAFLMSVAITFCSMMRRTVMTWTRYSLLFPYAKVAIWKLVPSGILTLIFSIACLLCRSKGGTYGIGGEATDFPLLHSKFLRPSSGDLRLELMACYQSGVSRMRR
jgi:hypothetical protein